VPEAWAGLSAAMQAFQSGVPLGALRSRRPTRPSVCACAAPPPPPPPLIPDQTPPPPSSAAPIPRSLREAATQATAATRAALAAGRTRAFVAVDTTGGDETFTLLKNSVPLVRMLLPILTEADEARGGRVEVLLPDAGAAALARRDWREDGGTVPDRVVLGGMDRWVAGGGVGGVFIVAPRASEVEDLERAVLQAADLPVVVVNPDLVDMGVTGLSLNARMLRERVIDSFETTYYLKVFGWGVLLRAYPGEWGVWADDAAEASGFRCLATFADRPSNERIEEVLDAEADDGAAPAGGDWMRRLSRFMKVYMKG
jgi:Domain of unknown function (DUF1995)